MKCLVVSIIVLATAALAFAQDAPRAEVFGGYQYISLDTRGGIRTREFFNGWDIDAGYRVWKKLMVVADVGCGYRQFSVLDVNNTPVSVSARVYPILFGPRFSTTSKKVTLFAEGLVGYAYESASTSGLGSAGQNRFAMGGGGGFDVKLNRRFTLRLAKADYILMRSGYNFNNLRIASGLVFKFR